jgi:hypothetical protein
MFIHFHDLSLDPEMTTESPLQYLQLISIGSIQAMITKGQESFNYQGTMIPISSLAPNLALSEYTDDGNKVF